MSVPPFHRPCTLCRATGGHARDCDANPDRRPPRHPWLSLVATWVGFTGATVVRKAYNLTHRVSLR